MNKKKILSMLLAGTALCASMLFGGCGTSGSDSASSGNDGKVVIYSNADDEAVDAMKKALDNNGFKDKYMFQTFGTSELGGKLMVEGKNIELELEYNIIVFKFIKFSILEGSCNELDENKLKNLKLVKLPSVEGKSIDVASKVK